MYDDMFNLTINLLFEYMYEFGHSNDFFLRKIKW